MVSQGSAATSLTYGGIYNTRFIANFVLSLAVYYYTLLAVLHCCR